MTKFILASVVLAAAATIGAAEPVSVSPPGADRADPFPSVNEVLQGRVFESKFDRDVFFLRRIRESYSTHWPALLSANVIVADYVHTPDKLLRFVDELGAATAETDDFAAITNLALIISDPVFYANTNAYRPGILQAAAWALIKIGPAGREALAKAFSQEHYRGDPASLEVLADAVSRSSMAADLKLKAALEAAAFSFTAGKGGSYPRCTQETIKHLLRLPGGPLVVARHLSRKEILDDPVRFQAVIGGIGAARAVGLVTNLVELATEVGAKLDQTSTSPGAYRDALEKVHSALKDTIEQLGDPARRTEH